MWVSNKFRPITVIGPENNEFLAYYKKRGTTDPFTLIEGNFVYMGDNIHELQCSFPRGEYVIRGNDLTRGQVKYVSLSVSDYGPDIWAVDTNNKVSSVLKKIVKKGF